jgi:hypothetical protein
MAFFNNALKLAADTGNQFLTGKKIAGVYRLLPGTQEIGLDPVLLEIHSFDKSVLLKFLDNPRTFPAVNTELLPELALEDTFGFGLDQSEPFINGIWCCHVSPPLYLDNRCDSKDIVAPDHDRAQASSPLVINELDRLVHVDIEVLVHGNETPLQFPALVFDLD